MFYLDFDRYYNSLYILRTFLKTAEVMIFQSYTPTFILDILTFKILLKELLFLESQSGRSDQS